ncbi:hypothetical protein CHUAL_004371 [Chamberlinius hualienensis]
MRINCGATWVNIVHSVLLFTLVFTMTDACYFSQEFQGSFVGQYLANESGQSTHYSEINIVVDSIPVWGMCHKKYGHNVLLRDRTRTTNCYRCFSVNLRSSNMLQIHTEGLDKCYVKEEAALATCPTESSIKKRLSKEIILYRKPGSDSVLQQTLCPIGGRFKFTYVGTNALTINKGQHQLIQHACSEPVSEFSNCPYGFAFTVKYKQCNFPDNEASFQCLGDWDGADGERYLGLLDARPTTHSAVHRYRCAVYRRNATSGAITLSMSRDSTCNFPDSDTAVSTTSSAFDYETFVLTPAVVPSWPLKAKETGCKFPNWAQGSWQMFDVQDATINFTDLRTFQRSTMRCISQPENNKGENNQRYIVYSITQCGDERYNCLTMQQRGKLVMEFQLGQYPSLHYNESLCSDQQFAKNEWITQGMISSPKRASCPISGEYTGFIPDATGLCAKLSSDCNSPDVMYYSVSNCDAPKEVYEEREYRCLGEWEEDGVLYTYTQRRDLPGFQCFVGTIVEGEDVFIKEAGDNCVRGMDPLKFGMKMTKQDSCDSVRGGAADGDKPQYDQPVLSRTTPRDRYQLATSTKPWKPMTNQVDGTPSSGTAYKQSFIQLLIIIALLLFSSTNF